MNQDHLPTAAETAQSAVIAQLPEELQSLLLRLGLPSQDIQSARMCCI